MAITKISNSTLSANSYISEDWKGGYKLEVDLTSELVAPEWKLNFDLADYSIRGAYGVDLVDNGSGNYTIGGQGNGQTLDPGETVKAIFIIDEQGKDAIIPEFTGHTSPALRGQGQPLTNLMGSPISEPVSAPASAPQLSQDAISVTFENHSSGTVYSDAAQSKDWNVDWSNQMDKFASISSGEAHSGNNSLKMDYPANEQSNAGAKWMIPEQKEYYFSYWVKFDQNFDFDGNKYSGGKLPGLGEGDLASGGTKPNGDNGFTSRYMWREGGQATVYLYHMGQPGTYGEDVLLKGADGQDKYFQPGKWHNMVQRVQVNDAGLANGEMDVWMDNEQVLEMDGLRLNNGQGIDTAYFSTFHGGNGSDWWPGQSVTAHFDDFVVSTNAADVGL